MSQQRGEGAGRRRRQRAPGVPARRGQGCAHGASVVEKPGLAGEPDHGQVRDAVKETGLGLAVQEQQQSAPGLAAARRAAHAVDVVLDLRGEVVVDDVLDVLHVKPTGRDVGRHQDRRLALLELLEHPVALLLLLVAVDAERGEAVEPHLARELVAAALGLAEDEDLGAVHHLLEQPLQAAPLVVLLHDLHVLPDGVRRPQVQGADVDVHGVLPADVSREPLHLPRPRGAPHQRLPVRADLRGDLPHLRLEAHVQHAVRLIEHELRNRAKAKLVGLQEVVDAAGCADDPVHAGAYVPELVVFRGAAVAASSAEAAAAAKLHRLLLDLHCKFARWRNHKQHRIPGLQAPLQDIGECGQQECQGLTAARGRDTDGVALLHCERPCVLLDLGWSRETRLHEIRLDAWREGCLLEGRVPLHALHLAPRGVQDPHIGILHCLIRAASRGVLCEVAHAGESRGTAHRARKSHLHGLRVSLLLVSLAPGATIGVLRAAIGVLLAAHGRLHVLRLRLRLCRPPLHCRQLLGRKTTILGRAHARPKPSHLR
mmetsp:Transcript_110010/g.350893  ORF Transcript_110010/g.350893 Transcript_110010/m.350893 type:complete len:542 (+) Transcript_110010:384-2009(+)